MTMIDYLTLLLINMVAGLVLLAAFVWWGLDEPDKRRWAPGFTMVGTIATVFGAAITLTWPLKPVLFNTAFGEMSVLFGIAFLGAGFALALGWSLETVAGYAFFAGGVAMLVGLAILVHGLTKTPLLAAAGFAATGFAGVAALPYLLWLRRYPAARIVAVVVLLSAAGIWALTTAGAYWAHLTPRG
jgi:putative membrane protein